MIGCIRGVGLKHLVGERRGGGDKQGCLEQWNTKTYRDVIWKIPVRHPS